MFDFMSVATAAFEHGPAGIIAFLILFAMMIWQISLVKFNLGLTEKRHVENTQRFERIEQDIKTLIGRR